MFVINEVSFDQYFETAGLPPGVPLGVSLVRQIAVFYLTISLGRYLNSDKNYEQVLLIRS